MNYTVQASLKEFIAFVVAEEVEEEDAAGEIGVAPGLVLDGVVEVPWQRAQRFSIRPHAFAAAPRDQTGPWGGRDIHPGSPATAIRVRERNRIGRGRGTYRSEVIERARRWPMPVVF